MRPLLINTFDRGGAANACLRLHEGLLKEDIPSKLLVKKKSRSEIPHVHQISIKTLQYSLRRRISNKLLDLLRELNLYDIENRFDPLSKVRPEGLEMYSYPLVGYDITKSYLYKEAELINLHWVADFLDYPSFFKEVNKPVVWTLHDQNPFLGVEHYSEVVIGINENGYPIERKISKREKEIFDYYLKVKIKAIQNFTNLTIITPSSWLSKEANSSQLFGGKFKIETIPYGLNSEIYQSRNKKYSRDLLNIPEGKIMLLFVAESKSNKRKGFEFLERALQKIETKDIVLCSVGETTKEFENQENYIDLGYIKDELLMSVVYSAADVFIIPSLMDNLPNTVLESLMCGTPVIGFPVGGIPDMVQDGFNGFLTHEISVPALRETIEKFLAQPDNFVNKNIREEAVSKYELAIQARKYIRIFENVIE